MFAWGSGAALGCGSSDTALLVPHCIEDLDQYVIIDISVGDSHCLALSLECEVSNNYDEKLDVEISEKTVTVCKFYVLELQSLLIAETGNVSRVYFHKLLQK